MVSDLDIYRTANLLIEQHGADDAKLHAAQRADELLAKGNLDGCRNKRRQPAGLAFKGGTEESMVFFNRFTSDHRTATILRAGKWNKLLVRHWELLLHC